MEWLFVGFVALFMVPAIVVGFSHDVETQRGTDEPESAPFRPGLRGRKAARIEPATPTRIPTSGVRTNGRSLVGLGVGAGFVLVSIAALVVACVMIAGGGG